MADKKSDASLASRVKQTAIDAAKYVKDMVSSGNYSTETIKRSNDVTRGVATYQGTPTGQGAVKNAADAIKARKKVLEEI